jgi:hypothetical protein
VGRGAQYFNRRYRPEPGDGSDCLNDYLVNSIKIRAPRPSGFPSLPRLPAIALVHVQSADRAHFNNSLRLSNLMSSRAIAILIA